MQGMSEVSDRGDLNPLFGGMVLDAKNVVVITLTRDEAQRLLNLIDDLHEQFQKDGTPDIEMLLQLADAIDNALAPK